MCGRCCNLSVFYTYPDLSMALQMPARALGMEATKSIGCRVVSEYHKSFTCKSPRWNLVCVTMYVCTSFHAICMRAIIFHRYNPTTLIGMMLRGREIHQFCHDPRNSFGSYINLPKCSCLSILTLMERCLWCSDIPHQLSCSPLLYGWQIP